jgi:hypothetical protein
MRRYRILELVITRDQTRNALHAPSRSLQESPQEGTAGTEPTVPFAPTTCTANRIHYHSMTIN